MKLLTKEEKMAQRAMSLWLPSFILLIWLEVKGLKRLEHKELLLKKE